MIYHTLEWFLSKIGRKIYRDKVSCPCNHCKSGEESGIGVFNKMHAQYLFDCQNEMGIEYRETK
jgi:hypothetical protein